MGKTTATKKMVRDWRKRAVVRMAQRYALYLSKSIIAQANGRRLFTVGLDCPLSIGKTHRKLLRVRGTNLKLVARFVLMDGKEERLTGESPAIIFAKWFREASNGKKQAIDQAMETLLQELWFSPQDSDSLKRGDGLDDLLPEDIPTD